MDAFDAVVVGAGHNGLAAAIHLLNRGWSVAVIEQAGEPGGAVKTREVTLPGFRHDLCAMNLSLFAGSPFFAAHKDELMAQGLAFAPAADCFASVFRDHTYLGVSKDLEKTAAAIAALSAKDAAAWRAMLARFGEEAPHIFGLLGSPMPSLATARTLWSAWRAKGASGLLDLGRLLLASPRDFLDAHFESPKVKAMMAAWGMHLDFPPEAAGGALFPYLESMANQAFGMVIGAGGADVIIRAMTGLIKAKGGEIRLNVAGRRGSRATQAARPACKLDDGTRIAAKKAVIANLHPQIVFGRLMSPDPKRKAFDEKVARIRAGPGTMMIHLALDSLPDWRAGPELQRFAYVHVAPDLAMMSRAFAEAAAGLLPAEPVLVVGQPTAIDPTRAPPGKHVLWVQVRVLAGDNRRRRARPHSGDHVGRGQGALRRARARYSRDLCARPARQDSGALRLVAARPRAREPLPDRRRQSDRKPSPRPELRLQAGCRLLALRDADAAALSLRRGDLAGRGDRRRVGLYAGENAGAMKR